MGCSLGCFNNPPTPTPTPTRSLYICCLLHVCCRHTSICSSYGNQASVWQPQDLCWNSFINVSTCFSEVCANDACHRFPGAHAVVAAPFHWLFSLMVQQKCKNIPSNPQEARGAPTHSSRGEGGIERILITSNAVLLLVVGSTLKGVLIQKR